MKFSMTIEGQDVRFDITRRKRQKRIYIKPHKHHHYRVSAPYHASKRDIEAAIKLFKKEILAMPALITPFERLLHGETVKLFGSDIPVRLHSATRRHTTFEEDVLHLYTPGDDELLDKKAVERRLKKLFLHEVQRLHETMQRMYPELIEGNVDFSCRYMKSKFGSAQPQTRKVTLNLALVHYPFVYTEYIYAHEMAHFLHPNHSSAFYRTLGRLCPNHKTLRKSLDEYHKAYTTVETRDKTSAV